MTVLAVGEHRRGDLRDVSLELVTAGRELADELDTDLAMAVIGGDVEGFAEEVPDWLANHRNDFFAGETTHEIGTDLELTRRQDINRMKMIDSYKGVRHKRGQKVRGQRTKSTGRSEGTIGVNVEAIKEEAAEAAEEEDE